MASAISFDGKTVHAGDMSWNVGHTIADVRHIDGRVIVLYEHWRSPGFGEFRNLEAFDPNGSKLWTAETPQGHPYVNFVRDEPLTVSNWGGFVCVIDPCTGKLISADFTK